MVKDEGFSAVNHDRKICSGSFYIGKPWENDGLMGYYLGKPWENGGLMGFNGIIFINHRNTIGKQYENHI